MNSSRQSDHHLDFHVFDFDSPGASATDTSPMFSICIPHFNRTRHLLLALDALTAQSCQDFELCISDDRSTDGGSARLREFLRTSGFSVRYRLQPRNLKYDGNLRSSIALSRGRFCLLMGNDDCLNGSEALAVIRDAIAAYGDPSAIITDFADWRSRKCSRRIVKTHLTEPGPRAALTGFRNATFVSGLILEGDAARQLATSAWDGSEMYQVYLLCRIVASGGKLLQLADALVLKDIIIDGEHVDSYADEPRLAPCPLLIRDKPLSQLPRLVASSIAEGASLQGHSLRRISFSVALQLYLFTFPYWLMEFRRIQSRSYALGVAMGLAPSRACHGLNLGPARSATIWLLFLSSVAASMVTPWAVFSRFRTALYRLAKSA